MALHGGTPYPQALRMRLSELNDFFGSKSFGNYRSGMEARQRMHLAVLSRFDGVLKGMNSLGKLLASVLRSRR